VPGAGSDESQRERCALLYLLEVARGVGRPFAFVARLGSGAQEKQSERQKATIIRFKFIFLEILLVPDALMYKKPLVPLSDSPARARSHSIRSTLV
jgi:hypothetical protein